MQSSHASPVLRFFVLVFGLSIPFWILAFFYPVEILPGLPISALGAFSPALAALILVYRNDRLPGVLRLLRRSFDLKRIQNKVWLFVILLVNPAISVLAFVIIRATGKALPNPAALTLFVIPLFAFFFLGGLVEEIGWSGYATEPLQQRRGTITAGVLIGIVWAVWHFIPLLQAHRSVEWIAWWSLETLSQRMIIVWLYIHSGKSVFGAAVFHAMINLCWQLFPINGSYYDPRISGLITLSFAIIFYGAERVQSAVKRRVT